MSENPNNCAACDYKEHDGGGHCYMFRTEPTGICMQHTARKGMSVPLMLRALRSALAASPSKEPSK